MMANKAKDKDKLNAISELLLEKEVISTDELAAKIEQIKPGGKKRMNDEEIHKNLYKYLLKNNNDHHKITDRTKLNPIDKRYFCLTGRESQTRVGPKKRKNIICYILYGPG